MGPFLAWFCYGYVKIQTTLSPPYPFFHSNDLAGNCLRQKHKSSFYKRMKQEEFHAGSELRSCLRRSWELVSTSSFKPPPLKWWGASFLPTLTQHQSLYFQGWQSTECSSNPPQGREPPYSGALVWKQIGGGRPGALPWLLWNLP